MTSGPPEWFLNRQRAVRLDEKGLFRFGAVLRRRLAGDQEYGVTVVSEAAMRRAHARFRGASHATDVLSFPDGEAGFLGDILICARQAERQAAALGHGVDDEVKILMLHGVLHLLGYDHERDRGEMRRLETRWRRTLRLPRGRLERGGGEQR